MVGTNSARILVVEDDIAISDIVCKQIIKLGFTPEPVFSGTEAKRALASEAFDLVITDLMLPGLDGEDVVRLIRKDDDSIPIIVLSARRETSDKVDLLSLGADDYMTKPFDLEELSARVLVQLRNSAKRLSADALAVSSMQALREIVVGSIRLVPSQRQLSVHGSDVQLTRTEYDLLLLLAEHPKRVFTKEELYEHIWGEPPASQDNSVSTHISNIRAKLKPFSADDCIQTVWGIGFKIEEPQV